MKKPAKPVAKRDEEGIVQATGILSAIDSFIAHVESTQGKSRGNIRLVNARRLRADAKELWQDEKDGWFDA